MKNLILALTKSLIVSSILLALITPPAYADDLEIYGVSESENLPVNVLFIFDVSGSMGWGKDGDRDPEPGESRYEIMLEALKKVLDGNKDTNNLKVGVSWFSANSSGIRWPVTDILADAHDIDNDIPAGAYKSYEIIPHLLETNAQPSGSTGIVQALFEASQYFRGGEVWAGKNEADTWNTSTGQYKEKRRRLWPAMRKTYTDSTRNGSGYWNGAKYISPIIDRCTPNFIVLLSDGEPTSSSYDARKKIEAMTGTTCADIPNLDSGKCGAELVHYLANNDQLENQTGTDIRTFSIGFNITGKGKTFLQSLAANGNGEFYSASDASDLEHAFNNIIRSITAENESFSSLVTTIRASTLSSDNRVFLNMFKPAETRSWQGNTKGYFIDSTGLLDVDGNSAVMDDPDGPGKLDKFKESARSFWSNNIDGNFVHQGGASGEIENNNSRQIYTYTEDDAPNKSALTKITTNNSKITPAMMGVIGVSEKREVLDWLLNDSSMGDPLHAKPLMISYANSTGKNKRDIIFSMTNQGLLHAIDASKPSGFSEYDGGEELFAFIPQALLSNLKDHKANLVSSDHLYGLDGALSYYHDDTNNDTYVNPGEKTYLYFGMRRGGRNYYALDISNLSSPSLTWRIEGGTGDFTQLGQTWSRPTPTTINWNGGSTKKVIIFGGGYDQNADNHLTRTPDTMGNAIFIVDALTGKHLWSATKGESKVDAKSRMKFSIPGDIRVIDSNFDRIADRLYFSDVGGQIWRIDLVDGKSADNKDIKDISGYVIARLTPNDSNKHYRRFYSVPEVAKMEKDSSFYYAVAVGSGFRAHPNSLAVQDRVYMIKDTNVITGPPSVSPAIVYNGHLLNITNNVDKARIERRMATKKGWRLHLKNLGEKSMTPMLIFNSHLAFTTFTPTSEEDTANSNSCGGGGGTGRYYQINLENGMPVKNFYDDTTPTANLTAVNRSKVIPGQGIPTEVVRRFLDPMNGGGTQETVGKGIIGNSSSAVHRANWKKVE